MITNILETIKPFLSDKERLTNKMTLIDKEKIIMGDYNTAKVMNTFFSNLVGNLNIAEYSNCESLTNNISDPVLKCVVKYRNHPNLALGEVCNKHPKPPFSFSKINREETLRKILKLETSEACQDTDIPTKVIKENADIFADIHLASFSDSVEKYNFPSSLKEANIAGKYKRQMLKKVTEILRITTDQSAYFQICLKYLSDVFFCQLYSFMLEFSSKYQCGFRKGYSMQHCLLATLEKWKSAIDKGKSFGTLLTDLSKAFDCLSHELLLGKLHA